MPTAKARVATVFRKNAKSPTKTSDWNRTALLTTWPARSTTARLAVTGSAAQRAGEQTIGRSVQSPHLWKLHEQPGPVARLDNLLLEPLRGQRDRTVRVALDAGERLLAKHELVVGEDGQRRPERQADEPQQSGADGLEHEWRRGSLTLPQSSKNAAPHEEPIRRVRAVPRHDARPVISWMAARVALVHATQSSGSSARACPATVAHRRREKSHSGDAGTGHHGCAAFFPPARSRCSEISL